MALPIQPPANIWTFLRSRFNISDGKRPDSVLLLIVMLLCIVGVMMIYSVSVGPNVQGGRDDPFSLVERHVLVLVAGIALMLVLAMLDYHMLLLYAVPLMIVTLVMLAVLLIFGHEEQGARRWLLGPSVQPGEFAKLITIIYVAAWLASKGKKLSHPLYGLIPFAILVGVVAGLIALQPNYSTAILIASTAFVMFFIAGADLKQFIGSALVGGAAATLIVTQSSRALARFSLLSLDPSTTLNDQGWQMAQTLMALASGGVFGKGLGTGGGQYGYVPLAHSDGIFAIWGEETGMIGTCLLVLLFLAFAWRGFQIAMKAPDAFGRVLAVGVTFWLVLQALVNIGVVTQLIPFTGQPLPFISFGGSSLVTTLAGIGLILSVSRARPPTPVVKSTVVRAPEATRALKTSARTYKDKNATFSYGGRNGGDTCIL